MSQRVLARELLEIRVGAAGGLISTTADRGTTQMDTIKKLYARADRLARGQTMTEYAMILATIAIVCLAAYQLLATDLQGMLGTVDGLL